MSSDLNILERHIPILAFDPRLHLDLQSSDSLDLRASRFRELRLDDGGLDLVEFRVVCGGVGDAVGQLGEGVLAIWVSFELGKLFTVLDNKKG